MAKEIVQQYCEQKEQEKVLKASLKNLNDQIKDELKSRDETGFDFGKYHVKLQTRVKEEVNEEKVLAVLKDFWDSQAGGANKGTQCPYIKRVEVLDMDALENAIYKGDIPDEVLMSLDKCRVKSETVALTYKIDKEDE